MIVDKRLTTEKMTSLTSSSKIFSKYIKEKEPGTGAPRRYDIIASTPSVYSTSIGLSLRIDLRSKWRASLEALMYGGVRL